MNEFNYDLAPAGKRMAVLMPGDEKDAWAGYRVNATRLPAFIPQRNQGIGVEVQNANRIWCCPSCTLTSLLTISQGITATIAGGGQFQVTGRREGLRRGALIAI
jgi:hypothetical protein